MSILISPCISMAEIDAANNSTDIRACPNTVTIERVTAPNELRYARYQDNAFLFMKVISAKQAK